MDMSELEHADESFLWEVLSGSKRQPVFNWQILAQATLYHGSKLSSDVQRGRINKMATQCKLLPEKDIHRLKDLLDLPFQSKTPKKANMGPYGRSIYLEAKCACIVVLVISRHNLKFKVMDKGYRMLLTVWSPGYCTVLCEPSISH